MVLIGLLSCQRHESLSDQAADQGFVVERVIAGSIAEQVGLRADDWLTGWQIGSSDMVTTAESLGGERFKSVLDWRRIMIEYLPRGGLHLQGVRGKESVSFTLPRYLDGITIRPHLSRGVEQWYDRVLDAVELSNFNEVKTRIELLIRTNEPRMGPEVLWWFLITTGTTLLESQEVTTSVLCLEQALVCAQGMNSLDGLLYSHHKLGKARFAQNDYQQADYHFQAVLELEKQNSISGLQHAHSLAELGKLRWYQGQLDQAENLHMQALALREQLAPSSIEYASSLNDLGIIADERGELAQAETYYARALDIFRTHYPESQSLVDCVNNLAVTTFRRGDYELAEMHFRTVLAYDRKREPESLEVANSLANLAIIAVRRFDYDTAELYTDQALAIEQKLAPGSNQVALSLSMLGAIARKRGALEQAVSYYEQGLAIVEKLSPQSLTTARTYNNLGNVALDRQQYEHALDYYRRSLFIKNSLAPNSLEVARSLNNLGKVYERMGQAEQAEKSFREALSITTLLAPRNTLRAEILSELGQIYYRKGELEQAVTYLYQAIDVLEDQLSLLGGLQNTRAEYQSTFLDFYRNCVDYLIELGKPEPAFRVLERSRSRFLLEMLSDRELVFSDELDPSLQQERRRLSSQYDDVQRKLWQLDAEKKKLELLELGNQLHTIQSEFERLIVRLKAQSPRYAALHFPFQVDVPDLQNMLDQQTAILSYGLNRHKLTIFVITAKRGLEIYRIQLDSELLRSQVNTFRELVNRPFRSDSHRQHMVALGHELYKHLIGPCTESIRTSPHLLIFPDGSLHLLPFNALVTSTGPTHEDVRYLIQDKAIHISFSASVYSELKMMHESNKAIGYDHQFIAFADPIYPDRPDPIDNPLLEFLIERHFELGPLPETGREVKLIAALFSGQSRQYTGAQATDTIIQKEHLSTRYLHFACHGLIDNLFPLNSGLLLTVPAKLGPDQHNGFLQAWEIFEHVRIRTELVVLSACNSGLGKEVASEGLMGLTRAFHYAGAPAIVASLWRVSDRATQELMIAFYRSLESGVSKDEALRSAQLTLLNTPHYKQPFYWAAFQLYGYPG